MSDDHRSAKSHAISFKGSGFATSFDVLTYDVTKDTIRSIPPGNRAPYRPEPDLGAKTLSLPCNCTGRAICYHFLNYIMQTNDQVEFENTLAGHGQWVTPLSDWLAMRVYRL